MLLRNGLQTDSGNTFKIRMGSRGKEGFQQKIHGVEEAFLKVRVKLR